MPYKSKRTKNNLCPLISSIHDAFSHYKDTYLTSEIPAFSSLNGTYVHQKKKTSFSMRYLIDIQSYDANTNVWQFLRLVQYLIWTNIPVASCFKLFTFVYLKFFIKCLHDLSTI